MDIVGCGEMGIGNSTSAAAIIAAVTGRPPRAVTGRGTGVDDERFEQKIRAIEQALQVNRPDATDGIDGDTIVVDGVPRQIILRSGKNKATLTFQGQARNSSRPEDAAFARAGEIR